MKISTYACPHIPSLIRELISQQYISRIFKCVPEENMFTNRVCLIVVERKQNAENVKNLLNLSPSQIEDKYSLNLNCPLLIIYIYNLNHHSSNHA